jgi:large subunit ribosomal protein L3
MVAMLISVFGKKIGMTQVFDSSGNVIPVTVIDIDNLYVTQIKNKEKDGYVVLQLGLLRDKYLDKEFSESWLKNKKMYFSDLKEVAVDGDVSSFKLCQKISLGNVALEEGQVVAVTGRSKGLGFQGVVKRWNFAGGPKTHGSTFHRKPGSVGHMRTQGEVIKGKRLPGHKGDKQFTVEGLKLVKIDKDKHCLLVKGAVPGKSKSLVLVSRQGK